MADFVKAKLEYIDPNGPKPYIYGFLKKGDDAIAMGGTPVVKEVNIRNGRYHEPTLDHESFQLVNFPTSLKENELRFNQQRIIDVYHKEIEDCIKKVTGAEVVRCFNHRRRNVKELRRSPDCAQVSGYSSRVHCDTTPENAEAFFASCLRGLDPRFGRGRFVFINAWRNIKEEPLQNHHLCFLDAKSLSAGIGSEDYIRHDFYGHEMEIDGVFIHENFTLCEKNSNRHLWYFFPHMTKDELVLFKQYDSDLQQPARLCFHNSFEDPNAPVDAPLRESLEIRAIAFFPEHVPNTCPSPWRVKAIMAKIRMMGLRDRVARLMKNIVVGQ